MPSTSLLLHVLFCLAASPASTPGTIRSHAEMPLWPIGLRLPDALLTERAIKQPNRKADVLVWVPDGARHIRAMILVPENTDSKHFLEHEPLRQVASRHAVALVYMRGFHTGIEYQRSKPTETPPAAPENILELLDLLATETGIAEFRHAPWISFGKSSRGEFPFRIGWNYPERTIAAVTYHGEGPTWPIPPYAKPQDQSILYVAANGEVEWDGTWYRHVRPFILNYRAKTAWLPHQLAAYGVGHGDYVDAHGSPGWAKPVPDGKFSVLRTWDYLTLFIDKSLTLRLPEQGFPTEGPIALRQVDPDQGYLVHPHAIEELLGLPWMALRKNNDSCQTIPWPEEKHPVLDTEQGPLDPKLLIRKATDVPLDQRKDYLWIADRELALAWLKLHNVKNRDVPIP
jgi:hypothetical protein